VTAVLLLAAVTFGAPFSDGCVLQRGRPVPVWGLASPGEEIKVVFADKSAVTHAGADGAWRVDLPALEASAEGRELKANGAIVRDVLVGEVWLASGQSNMAFPLRAGNPRGTDRGGALAAGMTRIPALRYASVPSRRADRPRHRFPSRLVNETGRTRARDKFIEADVIDMKIAPGTVRHKHIGRKFASGQAQKPSGLVEPSVRLPDRRHLDFSHACALAPRSIGKNLAERFKDLRSH
jgi:hypothetical protein